MEVEHLIFTGESTHGSEVWMWTPIILVYDGVLLRTGKLVLKFKGSIQGQVSLLRSKDPGLGDRCYVH